MELYPVKLKPVFKDYIWGGNTLKSKFNKQTNLERVAESWELAVHKEGECKVQGGPHDGIPLSGLLKLWGAEVLGSKYNKADKTFPLLIKFIDAKDNLSIQVHPSDDYSLKVEGQPGKTEMWYIINAEEDAKIIYGFKDNITKEEFLDAVKNNTLTDILNVIPVKKGEAYFIPSGTVHAICKGSLIAEIQQNSNVTYRIYDYDRIDKDGNKRPLHLDKAVDVIDFSKQKLAQNTEPNKDSPERLLAHCKYFKVYEYAINGELVLHVGSESFLALNIVSGDGFLEYHGKTQPVSAGDSFFIPANMDDFKITGNIILLVSTL